MASREEKNLSEQIHKLSSKLQIETPPTEGLDAAQLRDVHQQLLTLERQRGGTGDEQSQQQARQAPAEGERAAPPAEAAPVNEETGISPVEASGGMRTEGVGKTIADSSPDEIAPLPALNGGVETPEPAPSSTGYRVAPGKAVLSGRGDTLSDGAEIGERDVAGGEERLNELVESGSLVKTGKS